MAVRARSGPGPVPAAELPRFPVLPVDPGGVVLVDRLRSDTDLGPGGAHDTSDALLRSPLLADSAFTEAVHDWAGYWTGPATRWFPDFLARMAERGEYVDSALARAGLPPSLRYLPLIESGYDPRVTSRAGAVGMWQLMPPTARDLGLEVGPVIDERRHPERSTEAAIRYLRMLHDEFESWPVVLAAYNSGPERVRVLLRTHAPGAEPTDSLYWALRDHFPSETRDFVPKLYSAMWVASRPEAYGYVRPDVAPLRVDLVTVPDRTTLDVVALAAGVDYPAVLYLNPEFLRGATPRGRVVTVRLPDGRGRTFRRIFPRIRPEDRVTFREHEVRAGETLSQIATRYGLGVGELERENPRISLRSLSVGTTLIVPVARPPDEHDVEG